MTDAIHTDTAEIQARAREALIEGQRLVRQCLDLGIDLELDGECPMADRCTRALPLVPGGPAGGEVMALMRHIQDLLKAHLDSSGGTIKMRGDCPLFEMCLEARGLTVDLEAKTVSRRAES
ncbi:MAG: hypothetical protein KAH56_09665 [Candidatus Krumholzibacteria bacterium]|nr:hypothetical protein [Candidatus Krumholzibacteria bacterium]